VSSVSKFEIVAEPAKCVGCLICSLRCSLRFEKAFNPMKAAIRVITYFDRDNEISFSDHCDSCGICARYCPYGALTLKERQA
jgi:ferredoxin